ncbi:MAG TPA: hypothetical protein VFX58_01745 [Chitinophagaceae bacterium]|nr:hypothetical protein [Chitinophagaceae bacterium]
MKPIPIFLINIFFLFLNPANSNAQMITGVWQGKINRQKAEVKIIQDGDSLRGTSYYFTSPDQYRRYSIRGYFNPETNEAVWWDEQLLEEKTGKFNLAAPGKNALLSSADFNCPGSGKMMLDGKAGKKENGQLNGEVHLDKVPEASFADEWDYIIDNYLSGTNDPDIIDSIASVRAFPHEPPVETVSDPIPVLTEKKESPVIPAPKQAVQKPDPIVQNTPQPKTVQTIEEKFTARKKILTKEIPISGDSIELRFYDNAEIDGDSISLFLNEQLIFRHIRLTGQAYTIKLPVSDLKETNELIMVAENLGSIPPNTSYMVAIVGENRYEARLESNEGSSAMVKFVKNPGKASQQ